MEGTGQIEYSAAALLDKAAEFLEQMNVELAFKFCERVLEREPHNPRALEMRGLVFLEQDNAPEACAALEAAVAAQPDEGHTKYMYLGQVLQGEEAVRYYSKGLEVMNAKMEELMRLNATEETLRELSSEMSTAFCALAEVYLTDLCDVEDAQQTCLALMEKALEADSNNTQALQTLATIHVSMQDFETALTMLERSMAQWFTPSPGEGDEVEGALQDPDPDQLPPYEFRVNTAKLLLELHQFDAGCDVLSQLLLEDDHVMQVWYLMGWAQYLGGAPAEAQVSLARAAELYTSTGSERPEVQQHIAELLAKLQAGDTQVRYVE